jgi:Clp amino terminal domain, pathogenicity island component
MMFERFTVTVRRVVVQAQEAARRLGHGYIGCEHLLLALVSEAEPASLVLRDHGVTPDRVEAEIVRTIGRGPGAPSPQPREPDQPIAPAAPGPRAGEPNQPVFPVGPGSRPDEADQPIVPADPLGDLDREALAAIGIDLDVVRARLEAAFGPDALSRAVLARRQAASGRRRPARPALGRGPVARLLRARHVRRARRYAAALAGLPRAGTPANLPLFRDPARRGHIPFTPRAKKSLELSLRVAVRMKDNYIGVEHLALALVAMDDGMVPVIMSAIGASRSSLRAEIIDRYRQAG